MPEERGGTTAPEPGNRTLRDGLVAGAVVVVVVALLVLARPPEHVTSLDRRLSTLRATPDGAMALYLTLQEMEVPVTRRSSPLVDAEPVAPALALLAAHRPVSPREARALLRRVEEGGALLYVPAPEDGLLDALPLALVPGRRRDLSPPAASRRSRWVSREDTVRGMGAFVRVTDPEVRQTEVLGLEEDSLQAVLELELGDGRILVVADGSILANETIRGSGAAPIIARWVADVTAARGPLAFDEYHQGVVESGIREGLVRFLAGHPAGYALLHLAGVGLLGLLTAGRRFGGPRPPEPRSRRSPLEHVEALAATYREAQARRIPRLLLLSGLARHLGRPRPGDEAEARALLRRLEGGGGMEPDSVRELQEALDREEGLVAVAAAVDRILKRRRIA